MRFLVDAQLPPALSRWLISQGYEAAFVGSQLPGETPDADIAAFAARHGWVLISKDEDFLTRHPPIDYALVWIRLGNANNRVLIDWLSPRLPDIIAALDASERLVEVR